MSRGRWPIAPPPILTAVRYRRISEPGHAHEQADAAEEMERPMSVAAHERDRDEVEEAAQVAVQPVARAPVLARAVVHGELGDLEAAIRGEHGDEAVELAVEPDPPQRLGAVRLQPAVDVVQPDARDDRRRPVEEARQHAPRPRVVPPRLPARDEVEPLVELREELRDLGGIVLEVGVDRDHDVALGLEEAGLERDGLPEVAAQVHDDDVRRLVVELGEHAGAAVGRAVVDEDHLERLVPGFECGGDLPVELLQRVLLVEERDDDRDHARRVQRGEVGVSPVGGVLDAATASPRRPDPPRSAGA